jgi:integrase
MTHFPKPFFKKKRGVWYVEIHRRQHNLGPDKDEAFRLYHQLMGQPQQQAVAPAGTLAPIIDNFLDWCQNHRSPDTYRWYRDRLERFDQKYPDLRVADLRPYHIQRWIDDMDVSSGTKRNYCRSVKRCLRWAKQQGYIDRNPVADMEMPRGGKREKVVSDAEWSTLLGCVSDRAFRDLLIVTWETGCRPQESLRVEGRHVDLANQRWVFPVTESKTDIPRIVYLTDTALAITKRLMLQHPTGPLFRNRRGNPWTKDSVKCVFLNIRITLGREILEQGSPKPKDRRRKYLAVDDADAREFMKTLSPVKRSGRAKTRAELLGEARRKLTFKAAKELGPNYCLYDLRHTWMNRMLTKGVDALTVAFLAGHSDPSTLAKVYAHLSQNPVYLLGQAKKAAG